MIEYGYDSGLCTPVRRTVTGRNWRGKNVGTPWVPVTWEEYKEAKKTMEQQQREAFIIAREEAQRERDRDRWVEEARPQEVPPPYRPTHTPTVVQKRRRYETVAERDARAAQGTRKKASEEIRKRWQRYPEPGQRVTVTVNPDEAGSWEVGAPDILEQVAELGLEDLLERIPVPVPSRVRGETQR